MSEPVRCRHELVETDCGWCGPKAKLASSGTPAHVRVFRAPQGFTEPAGPVMSAAFDGRCVCGDRIDVGDEIRMQSGSAVHDGCEE